MDKREQVVDVLQAARIAGLEADCITTMDGDMLYADLDTMLANVGYIHFSKGDEAAATCVRLTKDGVGEIEGDDADDLAEALEALGKAATITRLYHDTKGHVYYVTFECGLFRIRGFNSDEQLAFPTLPDSWVRVDIAQALDITAK